MKHIKTNDGSVTLYNEEYKEHYHSISGAIEEAIKKYVEPCKVKEFAKTGKLTILDVGFGLGYNAIAAVDTALQENSKCEVHIISLEKDAELVNKLQELHPPLKHYTIIKKLEFDPITKTCRYEDKNILLEIKIGDAQETIKKIKSKVDCVFLDPFSPKKNPELWTKSFFSDIAKLMKPESILSTYSCARVARENFEKAGFEVSDGPIVGRRGPSTIARLKKE